MLGTTTPLLALILGALGALFGAERIPLISNVLMILAAGGAALLTQAVVRRLGYGRVPATLVTAILCFQPDTLWMTTGGMETPLVLLLMAASAWAAAAGRWRLAGACAALLVLARIDGVIWAAGISAIILIRGRRAAPAALATGAIIIAPWTLFALWYFGSPIPHSVIAKRVISDEFSLAGLDHMKEFATWALPHMAAALPAFALPGLLVPAATLLGLLLFAAGAIELQRTRRADLLSWMIVAFPFVFLAALYFGRSPIWFDWYLAPVDWCAVIVGGLGLWSLIRGAETLRSSAPRGRRLARPAVVALGLLYAASFWYSDEETVKFQRAWQINEDGTRRVVGEWLEKNTPPGAVVAMEAVGYQAYYSHRRVIDLAGLVSPEVVRVRRESASNAEAFHRILAELRPDYLVLRSYEVDTDTHYHGGRLFDSNEDRAFFWGHYEEVRRVVAPFTDFWGPTAYLTIYRRVG